MADQRREQMLQAALEDPQVTPARAFELSMKYASGQLGFPWSRRRGRN
jgi:hypothetical protein